MYNSTLEFSDTLVRDLLKTEEFNDNYLHATQKIIAELKDLFSRLEDDVGKTNSSNIQFIIIIPSKCIPEDYRLSRKMKWLNV